MTEYCSSDFIGNGARGPGLRDAMSILYTNFLIYLTDVELSVEEFLIN